MPQPAQVNEIAAELASLYQEAQARIEATLAQIAADPARFRQQRRLKDIQKQIDGLMADLDSQAAQAVRRNIDRTYEIGGAFTRSRVTQIVAEKGGDTASIPNFNSVPTSAVDELANGLHKNLLDATEQTSLTTKTMVREAVKTGVGSRLIEGKSSQEASAAVEGFLKENSIDAVTYSNGAKVQIGDYASMAIRSATAIAYNQGVFDRARDYAVEYLEVFDGPDCGWTDHDDGDVADGTIRSVDECEDSPISHPNCRRGFGPRPDVTSDEDAAAINDGSGSGDGEGVDLDQLPPSALGFDAVPLSEATPMGSPANFVEESAPAETPSAPSRHEKNLQQRQTKLDSRASRVR